MGQKRGPKPNTAHRLKWPQYRKKGGELGFPPGWLRFLDDEKVCQDLVQIINDMMGSTLVLEWVTDSQGQMRAKTDGKTIWIPRLHPNKKVATKHELAHNLFLSNLFLRTLFVDHCIEQIAERVGRDLPPYMKENLREDMSLFANLLDDVRINSLWSLVYPGSGVQEWYYGTIGPAMAEKAREKLGDDIQHFFTWACLHVFEQPVGSSRWDRFEHMLWAVREELHYKSFPAILLLMKKLVLAILEELIQEAKEDEKTEKNPTAGDPSTEATIRERRAAATALQQLAGGRRPGDTFADDNGGFDYKQQPWGDQQDAYRLLQTLTAVDVSNDDQLSAVLHTLEQEGTAQALRVQAQLEGTQARTQFPTRDDYIKDAIKANLDIVKVTRASVVPMVLSPEDVHTATEWRRLFNRILGALAMRTELHGQELLTDVYIQQRLAGEPLECFAHDTTGRGFRVLILVDMSSSMKDLFGQVERLVGVLQRAMHFPFVHIEVRGFNSTAYDEVKYYVYPPRVEGLISDVSHVTGVTPLSHAIQAAGQEMLGYRDDRHIFVLSDGFPVYFATTRHGGNSKRKIDTNTLFGWTHEAVKALLGRRIKVWCFMIGRWTPEPPDMDFMFGEKRWRRIAETDIYPESFAFLRNQFLHYVRSR